MIELLGIITTILAVSGAILNNRHRIECFYLWIFSNFLSAVIHIQTATLSLAVRDMVFLALAIEGVFRWKKAKKNNAFIKATDGQTERNNDAIG